MCLQIPYKDVLERPTPQIATQDIEVFKVISKCGHGWLNNLIIEFEKFPWYQGWRYIEPEFVETLRLFCVQIERNAFHSGEYKTIFERMNRYPAAALNEIIVKMLIPKGAKYFFYEGEYASSEIIYPYQQYVLDKDGNEIEYQSDWLFKPYKIGSRAPMYNTTTKMELI